MVKGVPQRMGGVGYVTSKPPSSFFRQQLGLHAHFNHKGVAGWAYEPEARNTWTCHPQAPLV